MSGSPRGTSPYGAFNATTLAILRALKMLVVLWTLDTGDDARPGVPRIVYTAVSGARPGAIILMMTAAVIAARPSPRCRASSPRSDGTATGW